MSVTSCITITAPPVAASGVARASTTFRSIWDFTGRGPVAPFIGEGDQFGQSDCVGQRLTDGVTLYAEDRQAGRVDHIDPKRRIDGKDRFAHAFENDADPGAFLDEGVHRFFELAREFGEGTGESAEFLGGVPR